MFLNPYSEKCNFSFHSTSFPGTLDFLFFIPYSALSLIVEYNGCLHWHVFLYSSFSSSSSEKLLNLQLADSVFYLLKSDRIVLKLPSESVLKSFY